MSNSFTNESLAELGSNIKNRLTKAFDYSITSADIATNKMFKEIIIAQLNILASIEKQLGDTLHESEKLNDRFIILSKEKNELKTDYKLSNFDAIYDEVNWFKIYVTNQYHVDIDSEQKIQVPDISEIEDRNSNPLNTLNLGALGGIFDSMPDQMADMAANMKLTNDIFSGKVYIYKGKPRIIPIIKKIYAVNSIIMGLLLILVSIFSICTMAIMTGDKSDVIDIVTALLFAAILLYSGINSCRIQFSKKTRNDNARYYFDWRNPMMFNIFLGIGLIVLSLNDFDENLGATIFNAIIYYIKFSKSGNDSADLFFLYSLFVVLILTYVSFLINIICLVFASMKNPEKDKEKISKLLSEYRSEFVKKNGKK